MKNSTQKHKYSIKTSPFAMSRIKKILEKISVDMIPDGEKESYDMFSASVVMELSEDNNNLKDFFSSITGSDDDFINMEFDLLVGIATDFFIKSGSAFRKLMQMKKKELQKQQEMVTSQMEKVMEKMMKDNLPGLLNNTT